MNKTTKRALDLLHNGYTPHNGRRRLFPKWRQAYAIAKREDQQFAAFCGARLMGTVSDEAIANERVIRAVRLPR